MHNQKKTKTNKAITLFLNGYTKEAFAIFKTFRIGFTTEQKRAIQIASECLNGNASFYHSLGIDTYKVYDNAIAIIKEKYNL